MVPFKHRLMSLSMGTKLALTFFAVILCVSFPISYLSLRYSENLLKKRVEEGIRETIRAHEEDIKGILLTRDYWRAYKRVEAMAGLRGIQYVTLLDDNNFVIAHSLPQQYPIGTYYRASEEEEVVHIKSFGRTLGSVVFKVNYTFIKESLLPLKIFMIVFTLIFSTIGISLGIFISIRLSNRFKKILRMAQDAEKGKLYRVSFSEKDELQEFSNYLYRSFENINKLLENAKFEGKFFSDLINALSEIVFVLDREGRILFSNRSINQYRYAYEDLIGRKFVSLIGNSRERNRIRNSLRKGEELIMEGVFKSREGKHPVLISLRPGNDFFVVSLRDISELKEMERQFRLMEVFSLLGEMSVGLAHELKNALLPLKLLADLEEWDREDVNIIRQSIARVDRVVVNMLNFARQDREVKSHFSLREFIEGLKNLFEPIVREKSINFVYDCEDLEVYMERGALELVLVNLIKNAMDAVDVGGMVELKVERDSDRLVFSVKDDGPGIPESIRKKIFEPFFTTKKGGTGLGLSIAMRYAYMLGGQISLKPPEGRGTVISLEVPFNAKGFGG